MLLDGRCHDGSKLLQIDRLGEVVEGAGLQGFDGVFGGPVGRHDDAPFAALVVLDALQYFHAEPIGQSHVGDHRIEALGRQMLHRLGYATGRIDLVAFAQQCQFVERAQVGFVVDHEDMRGLRGLRMRR